MEKNNPFSECSRGWPPKAKYRILAPDEFLSTREGVRGRIEIYDKIPDSLVWEYRLFNFPWNACEASGPVTRPVARPWESEPFQHPGRCWTGEKEIRSLSVVYVSFHRDIWVLLVSPTTTGSHDQS